MAKPISKGSSVLIKIILVAVIVYLLYVFIGLQVKINDKKAQIDGINEQISVKTTEKERLTSVLDAEVDADYVEKVARELGYVNADEKVYDSISE